MEDPPRASPRLALGHDEQRGHRRSVRRQVEVVRGEQPVLRFGESQQVHGAAAQRDPFARGKPPTGSDELA